MCKIRCTWDDSESKIQLMSTIGRFGDPSKSHGACRNCCRGSKGRCRRPQSKPVYGHAAGSVISKRQTVRRPATSACSVTASSPLRQSQTPVSPPVPLGHPPSTCHEVAQTTSEPLVRPAHPTAAHSHWVQTGSRRSKLTRRVKNDEANDAEAGTCQRQLSGSNNSGADTRASDQESASSLQSRGVNIQTAASCASHPLLHR